MIVVSDTTPLNYLILIEAARVLPALFGRLYAPTAVIQELSHPRSPQPVRAWASSPPEWPVVQKPTQIDKTLPEALHKGEVETISLARELGADWVLIDERKASREAESRDLRVAGTLAILEEGGARNLTRCPRFIRRPSATAMSATAKIGVLMRNLGFRPSSPLRSRRAETERS